MSLYGSQSFFMKYSFLVLLSLVGGFIVFSAFLSGHYSGLTRIMARKLSLLKRPASFYALQKNEPATITRRVTRDKTVERLSIHARNARDFINKHDYSPVCMFIDMKLESGNNRFFVYDLLKDSLLDAGLVTHGRCNESWLTGRRYGNKVGCGCTSLGKYKIGHAYKGRFGLAYKLSGLDSTNSNAFKRYVVLHAHECVPNEEVHPYPICQSDGCPTVSKKFLRKLAGVIDKSPLPVLLWIYD
jgi:hypothetical protein